MAERRAARHAPPMEDSALERPEEPAAESDAGPNDTGPSGADQSGADQSGADQSGADQSGADQSDAQGNTARGDAAQTDGRAKGLRLLALVVLVVGSILVARSTGVTEALSLERVRTFMEGAGVVGFLLFLGAFALGELVHVPGVVFVAAAILAYGRTLGGSAAYVGALVSVCVSFFVVRAVGGQPLAGLQRPWMKRILDRLEQRPVRVVAILRMILWMAPPLNYALAMSTVRFRDYLVGSAIGLLLPIALAALFLDWVVRTLL